MALTAGQLSYNGLTLGAGTIWNMTSAEKLLDPPEISEIINQKAGADGAWRRAKYYKERHIVLTGWTDNSGTDVADDLVSDFNDAFEARETNIPLAFNLGTGLGAQHYNCKPGPVDYIVDWSALVNGYVLWRVELIADDPIMYSGES